MPNRLNRRSIFTNYNFIRLFVITKKDESQLDDQNSQLKEDYSKVDISNIKENNEDEEVDNNNQNNSENSKYYTNNKYTNLANEINNFVKIVQKFKTNW